MNVQLARFESSDDVEDFEVLVDRARAGSNEALGEMLERLRTRLATEAAHLMRGPILVKAGVSDVVNAANYEAIRYFDEFRGLGEPEFVGWMSQILRNTVSKLGRHYSTRARSIAREVATVPQFEVPHPRDPAPSPSTQLRRKELRELILALTERLSDDQRQVIHLRYLEHLEFAEVAVRMGRSVDATKHLWERALRSLSRELVADPR